MGSEAAGSPRQPVASDTTTTYNPHATLRGGIRCPNCACPHHFVAETRTSQVNFNGVSREYIRRRRICRHCGLPFYSREVVEPELPDDVRHPQQAQQIRNQIKQVIENVIPEKNLPDLPPNPFLE